MSRIGSAASAPDPLPDSVRTEMAQAADLWASLQDEGKQLRYEVDDATGRVSAELRDSAGTRLRTVPLPQALGPGGDDSSAA